MEPTSKDPLIVNLEVLWLDTGKADTPSLRLAPRALESVGEELRRLANSAFVDGESDS
jgi:hypothetical protein